MACFNPSIAVGRQLLECLQIHGGCGKKSMKEIVLRWFRDLQVQDPERAYGSYCHELSGGMLQRAMLAMALINGPRLLIADEPTSALDDESCRAAIGQLLRLQRQLNFAVLFITHDRKLGESIAHCTASMEDGKIVSNT
jgi:ABC-type dipeptide/oligopeptide/nickel transport system ATPase component